MKTQEEIEQLALQRFPIEIVAIFTERDKVDKNKERRKIFIETYTQCQEDMTLQGKCLSGKTYDDCHIHSSNIFGCLNCGNFKTNKQD